MTMDIARAELAQNAEIVMAHFGVMHFPGERESVLAAIERDPDGAAIAFQDMVSGIRSGRLGEAYRPLEKKLPFGGAPKRNAFGAPSGARGC